MVWHLHMLDTHVGSMGIGGVDYLSGVKKTFLAIFGYSGMNMQNKNMYSHRMTYSRSR